MESKTRWSGVARAACTSAVVAVSLMGVTAVKADLSATNEHTFSSPIYQSIATDNMWTLFQRAEKYDAEYLQALSNHKAAFESIEQAYGRMLPSISLDARKTRTHQEIKSSDNQVFGSGSTAYNSKRYGANLTQPLFDWERFSQIDKAKQQLYKADAELALARQELILRVAERYLTVLGAQDNLEFLQKEEAAVRKQAEVAETRMKAKLGREADYLEAKARLASVFADRLEAETTLDDAIEALREISGAGAEKFIPLKEEIALQQPTPAIVGDWLDSSMKGNLRIQLQYRAMEEAREEIERQQAGHYPTLQLVGGWNREDVDGSLFGGGSDVETGEISLQLQVPLFEGGQVSSRKRQATELYHVEIDRLHQEKRAVTRETRLSFQQLNTSISRVESLKQAMDAQEVLVVTKRKGYPRLYTSMDVLDAERDLYSAKRDWARARYDYLLADLRLKAAAGSLQAGDLEQMNQLFN
ncbi:TolC family outer membrane protein [Litoribrevibacter euphylliae]|uniref:TolC family outer membrane protein n=1 Tax=Litoribrevibacter euphylliae TaxID=1834034 RepID=A0ABV7HJY0_9GAMM